MLWSGGRQVFTTNLCLAVLTVYFVPFLSALGALYLPAPPASTGLAGLDIETLRLFGGAALLVLGGFVLGVLDLLRPWLTASIFCLVLYRYFLDWPSPWLKAIGEGSALVRGSIALVLLLLFLTKGVLVNLYTSDDLQLYFPYLQEIRLQHGLWLDPARPVISDFLIGRGNGIHLFLASFTNQFIGQPVSLIFLLAIGLVVHRIVYRAIPSDPLDPFWSAARGELPECALLVALSTPVICVDFAKYHMQAGAFFLFLSWSSLLFIFIDNAGAKWLGCALVPVVMAIPLILPQYEAVALIILTISAIATAACRGWASARFHIRLAALGAAAAAASLGFNQFCVGIGEMNPAFLFLKFANLPRLGRWTSVEMIQYLNFAQRIQLAIPVFGVASRHMISSLAEQFVPFNDHGLVYSCRHVLLAIFALSLAALPLVASTPRVRARAGLDRGVRTFIVSLFAVYMAILYLTLLVNQGSLARAMEFEAVYRAIAVFAAAIVGIIFLRQLLPFEPRDSKLAVFAMGMVSVMLAATNLYAIDGGSPMKDFWKDGGLRTQLLRAVSYFSGRAGLIEANGELEHYGVGGQWDFDRCLEVGRLVPGPELILPLNAVFAIVPCQNSPLLPRKKLVHHYESVLAPFLGQVLFSPPEQAYRVYRKLGIDFFYVAKGDSYFWGPGFSESFSPGNLEKYFDVFHEDNDFLLLTWRGRGQRAVSAKLAADIEKLRAHARASKYSREYWLGVLRLKAWVATRRIQPPAVLGR